MVHLKVWWWQVANGATAACKECLGDVLRTPYIAQVFNCFFCRSETIFLDIRLGDIGGLRAYQLEI